MPIEEVYPFAYPINKKLESGGVALGLVVRAVRSPDIARVAKSSGHDFIFIDVQHSIFNLETIIVIAQIAQEIGIAPLARLRGIADPDAPVLLDNGVAGIVYPDINNADEARRAVDICKFPPSGKRSVVGGYPMFDYASLPPSTTVPLLNNATLLVCMIETLEGLDNVEDIAAVEGVDVVHLGTNDLLANMGKPGQFDDPEIVTAQERLNAACAKHGKVAGCGGNRDVVRQANAIRAGVRFLTTQSDVGFLHNAASRWTADIHAAIDG